MKKYYEAYKNSLIKINNFIPYIINEIKNKIAKEKEIDIKDSDFTISLDDIKKIIKHIVKFWKKEKS